LVIIILPANDRHAAVWEFDVVFTPCRRLLKKRIFTLLKKRKLINGQAETEDWLCFSWRLFPRPQYKGPHVGSSGYIKKM